LIDLEDLEAFDKEGIMNKLKFYQKLLKFLFNKYSSTGFSRKTKSSFDKRKDYAESINLPELWKFIKDHRLNNLIRLSEVKRIMYLLTTAKEQNWGILNQLNFIGFNYFMI